MIPPVRVLIVDDERFVRESLSEILKSEAMQVVATAGADEAIRALESATFDVIVTDLKMPHGDGMALLREASHRGVAIPIIVVTGVGTVTSAVDAMKAGAFDFVQKPVDPAELVLLVRRAAEHRGLLSEVKKLRHTVEDMREGRGLVGHSPAIQRVLASIAKVAPTDATVLLHGESGTGKELAAEEIHRASLRSAGELVRVNCAALTSATMEVELFGPSADRDSPAPSAPPSVFGTAEPAPSKTIASSRTTHSPTTARADGARLPRGGDAALAPSTGPGLTRSGGGKIAQADGGTLVLDKIGMLMPALQSTLLAVLEQGEYRVAGEPRPRKADVRMIAITSIDLAAKVKSGEFRADLYYRLNQFPIEMPPLRAHKEDIPELALHLLERARRRQRIAGAAVAPQLLSREALDVLSSYDWPGNIRELGNALERAAIVAGSAELDAELFRGILESALPSGRSPEDKEFHLRRNLDAVERDIVIRAIAHTQGKKKEAALLLGIDPRNLGYYLRKHKITET